MTESYKFFDPDEIETAFKAEPPFTKVKDGHGFLGVVLRDKKKDKLQCHMCGKWFNHLPAHITQAHKIKTRTYKKKYGLPLQFGLVSRGIARKCSDAAKKPYWERDKKSVQKHMKNMRDKVKRTKRRPKATIAAKNSKGLCDQQLLKRFLIVADIVGRNPTTDDVKTHDHAMFAAAVRRYKTFNKFRQAMKTGVIRYKKNKWKETELIAAMQRRAIDLQRVPKYKDMLDMRPNSTTIVRHFGSWNRAILVAFEEKGE